MQYENMKHVCFSTIAERSCEVKMNEKVKKNNSKFIFHSFFNYFHTFFCHHEPLKKNSFHKVCIKNAEKTKVK